MLDDIGFYTLTDARAKASCKSSPMWRCELIVTGFCNFKCSYCRGLPFAHMKRDDAMRILNFWIEDELVNIRFSGGEPTLYPHLFDLIRTCKGGGVERIAISTNGSMPLTLYYDLIDAGVNDFSISLDACCSAFGDEMSGVKGKWDKVIGNIEELSKATYVTAGIVVIEDTVKELVGTIELAHDLGVDDIRIISAAQWNGVLDVLQDVRQDILDAHPILKYRVGHYTNGRNVRGIMKDDCHKCHLVLDDSMVAGKNHYPCVIHFREGGKPIGKVSENMRSERAKWSLEHNTYEDKICRENCLDVCIDYNNQYELYREREV